MYGVKLMKKVSYLVREYIEGSYSKILKEVDSMPLKSEYNKHTANIKKSNPRSKLLHRS